MKNCYLSWLLSNLNRKILPDSRQRVRNKCTETSVQKRNEMKLNINEMKLNIPRMNS